MAWSGLSSRAAQLRRAESRRTLLSGAGTLPRQAVAFGGCGLMGTYRHSCVRPLLCRGQNVNSVFGPSNSALTTAYSPVRVDSGPWAQITVAQTHVCGIAKNASAYCWCAGADAARPGRAAL